MERPSAKDLIKGFESGGVKGKKLHVLFVYAHQEPKSFNGALKDVAVEVLRELGHTVEISDLYAQNFNPLCTRNEIKGEILNPNHFNYSQETQNTYKNSTLPEDIVSEQEKLNRADLVIFQFPMYWMSFPAILKGWFDRVFTLGYAFTLEAMCDEGLLKVQVLRSGNADVVKLLYCVTRHHRSHPCSDRILPASDMRSPQGGIQR
ncbi:ribosyldihydronicotinamide dehydrogenase [quinone] [Lingula anatina]|uniref:Ribosyldihydronicotinamide dehydrogenase [quinone] n=1 Tax=Lingula anatina TaxID=7574 RepID=A0A1S3K5F2_LINAN|nr:ribosyldihydronicotinamide dehydrogenase [quinone] [Lingula anatina]|eukprot:XP_013417649.1 ribosyldihydronicotinamide dehydrogenase [quinone] [Lingula anatina]